MRAGLSDSTITDRPAKPPESAVISISVCSGGRQNDDIANDVTEAISTPALPWMSATKYQ